MPEWTQESVEKEAAKIETEKPVVEQATETETPPDEGGEVKVKEERVVPIGAVHEERAKKREAIQRAQAMEAQNQQLVRQMQDLMSRMSQAQVQQPAADDVLGQLQHGVQNTQAELKALRENQARTIYEQQQREQYQQFVAHVHHQEAEFVKTQPDAPQAINFLKTGRVNQYKAAGVTHQEAMMRVAQDERDLIVTAMRNGDNPAKVAFDMAVAAGYVPPQKKLEMQREGQGASTPSGGAGKGGGLPSLESLLKMDHKSFAEATSGDKWEKLLKNLK